MPRLTKKLLDSLKPKSTEMFVWDSEIKGLGVRLKPSGTKTFFVQYRNKVNRTRRLVIGQYGLLTVELARELARDRLFGVLKGQTHPPREKQPETRIPSKTFASGTCWKLSAAVC